MKRDPLEGFQQPADAVVPCKTCGAVEGEPCQPRPKEKVAWRSGWVHFGRRLRRLLLTAGAPFHKRKGLEDKLVTYLREYLAEHRVPARQSGFRRTKPERRSHTRRDKTGKIVLRKRAKP